METNTYDLDSVEARNCMSQAVGVHTLASSPTNPRKTFDPAQMAELVQSVREHGILTPILVRCWPASLAWTGADMPFFEVVAGERRFRAAREAGLTLMPALVRDLSDAQVLEIQVIENLQRADLHPLEEADGYQHMMATHGYTADMIAAKIGKSRSYIFGRLKLLALDADSRRLFAGGLLNPSTALLVARIPTAKLRAQAIKELTEKDYQGDTKSVRQAQRWIRDRYMLTLADATFSPDDATLTGGACTTCPKRTGNVQDLFEDVDSPDVCTDPDCFGQKKLAVLQRTVDKAKENGAEVISGKDARKIAPHGFNDWSRFDDFTQLDSTCYDDADHRTYRQILGESVEVTLVEDAENQRLVPLIKNTVLADKLKDAGIESSRIKADKDKAKLQAKVEIERAYRLRLFTNIRTEIGNYTLDGVPTIPTAIAEFILRRVVIQLFERLYGDVQSRVSALWQAEGKNATERNKNFIAFTVQRMYAGELWRALVDLVTAGSVGVSEWMLDHKPEALLDMAGIFDLDAAEVRKDIENEAREQKKADKQPKQASAKAQKGKNPTAASSGDAPHPSEAARAGDSLRIDGLKVGDRVLIRMDIDGTPAWKKKVCGREGVIEKVNGAYYDVRFAPGKAGLVDKLVWNELYLLPDATQAAQAPEEPAIAPIPADAGIIETNETPIEAETGAGTGEAAVVETNEKPAVTNTPIVYRHPTDASVSWKGVGRPPNWVRAWMAEDGNTMDMLRVVA